MQKTKINNKGRPKTDWDSQSYDDINLKNLDTAKRKRFENIKSLNNKIFNIDKLIEKNQKLILRYLKSKKPILDQISLNNDELNKITRAINQKTKIFSKNNESITITRQKNYIRGKISYFGKALWCHIGSINK